MTAQHDCPLYERCEICGSIPIDVLHDKIMRECPPPWGLSEPILDLSAEELGDPFLKAQRRAA